MNGKKLSGYVCIKMDVNKHTDYYTTYHYHSHLVEPICYYVYKENGRDILMFFNMNIVHCWRNLHSDILEKPLYNLKIP